MNSSHFSHDVFISFSFKDQAVAENISNQLNHIYGIPCWICTTEIRAGDGFYDIISDAITASKVLLFVQTKNSVQSKEIPDEVCQAIGDGKTIVSFVVEDSELRGTLKLKLSGKQFVDGKKPTLDDRIEDLAHELCKILDRPFKKGGIAEAEEKEQKPKLKATPAEQLKPRKHFFGRDTLLDDLHKTFEEGERVVFLQGIGGIGKTQIAKNYVKKYGAEYDTIVYATYGGNIRDLILSDAPFTFDPPMNRLTKADGSKESDAEFFERKIAALRACATEKTLLILDNFDTIYDEQFDTLKDIGGRLLVTTRCDYSKNNRVVQIDPIEKIEDLKKVFLKNYDGYDVSEDDPALTELIELVNRHTYTIELLAQHMEISGQTAGEMVEALKKEGIRSLNEEVGAVGEKTEIAYKNLLKMFRIFSLTAEERQVLTLLSLMPLEGVNERDFRSWAELKSRKVILNLQKRSLIIENVGGIALHPIVRDVVRCEAPANEENCEVFLARFTETIHEDKTWHLSKYEKDRYALIVKELLTVFHEITAKTQPLYHHSESLLAYSVDPSLALQLAKKLYDYNSQTFGQESFKTAHAAFKIGWIYSFNSYLPNSLSYAQEWLSRSISLFEKITFQNEREHAVFVQTKTNLAKTYMEAHESKVSITPDERAVITNCKVNLARSYRVSYELTQNPEHHNLSKKYAQEAFEHAQNTIPASHPQYAKAAGALLQLAEVLFNEQSYEKALDHIEKAEKIILTLYKEDDSDSMYALTRKSFALYYVGRIPEAAMLAKKSALGYAAYVGEEHPHVCATYALLGDCNVAMGNSTEAQKAYEKALKIARRIYAPDARQLQEIEEKLKSIGCDRGTL